MGDGDGTKNKGQRRQQKGERAVDLLHGDAGMGTALLGEVQGGAGAASASKRARDSLGRRFEMVLELKEI